MNLKIIISIIILAASCTSSESGKWANIKKTKSIYPKESIETITCSVLQDTERIWINTSYKSYPYKEFCKNETQIIFDINQPIVKEHFAKDSLEIAQLLLHDFKKIGVSHFVGQTLVNKELRIYLYTENDFQPIIAVYPFKIPNESEFQVDGEWQYYLNLLKKE